MWNGLLLLQPYCLTWGVLRTPPNTFDPAVEVWPDAIWKNYSKTIIRESTRLTPFSDIRPEGTVSNPYHSPAQHISCPQQRKSWIVWESSTPCINLNLCLENYFPPTSRIFPPLPDYHLHQDLHRLLAIYVASSSFCTLLTCPSPLTFWLLCYLTRPNYLILICLHLQTAAQYDLHLYTQI